MELYVLSNRALDDKLAERFRLSMVTQETNPYMLQRMIYPVTQADELLKNYELERLVNDRDDGATGYYTIDTCPTGKIRWIFAVHVFRSTGAASLVNILRLYNNPARVNLKSQTAANELLYEAQSPMPWRPTWTLDYNVSTYNAGDKITAAVLYAEEDQF